MSSQGTKEMESTFWTDGTTCANGKVDLDRVFDTPHSYDEPKETKSDKTKEAPVNRVVGAFDFYD